MYRIVQYSLLMFLLAISSAHMTLKFMPEYEFYNDGTANLVLFAFLSSEVVNIGWWLNFIVHLKTWANNVVYCNNHIKNININKLFKKTKIMETISAIVITTFGLIYIWWSLIIIIYSLVDPQCKYWKPFQDNLNEEWKIIYCKTTLDFYNITILLLVSCGFLISLLKIIIGSILMYYLKHHMATYFHKHYRLTIVTIWWSWAIIWNRSLYYLISSYRECDLKYNFAAKFSFPIWQAPIQVSLTAFDILCPIGVCLLNIKTINFEKYLTELMKAWQLEKYWEVASIYIRVNTNYKIKSTSLILSEDQSANDDYEEFLNVSDVDQDFTDENQTLYKNNYEQIKNLDRIQKLGCNTLFNLILI